MRIVQTKFHWVNASFCQCFSLHCSIACCMRQDKAMSKCGACTILVLPCNLRCFIRNSCTESLLIIPHIIAKCFTFLNSRRSTKNVVAVSLCIHCTSKDCYVGPYNVHVYVVGAVIVALSRNEVVLLYHTVCTTTLVGSKWRSFCP
jgi:hypothetical protein